MKLGISCVTAPYGLVSVFIQREGHWGKMPVLAEVFAILGNFSPIRRQSRNWVRIACCSNNSPFWSFFRNEPYVWMDLGIGMAGHDLIALFLKPLFHDLHGKIQQFPVSDLDPLVGNKPSWIDCFTAAHVDQSPARSFRSPSIRRPSHRHEAGVAIPSSRDRKQPIPAARHLCPILNILQSDEEYLIANTERQVLEEWRTRIDLQPALQPILEKTLDVPSRSLPHGEEFGRGFSGFDLVQFHAFR